MNWSADWQAISARIHGLLDAGAFFYKALHHSSEDARSVKKKVLLTNAEQIIGNLKEFSEKFKLALPQDAVDSLNGFLTKPEMSDPDFFRPNRNYENANVQFALTSLSAFQSEFAYLIADTQFIARKITERAFVHLQRSIVVDDKIRQEWISAYNDHEMKCEKLGALHLLLHGIWGFKVNATGGRTDLILNEPLPPASIVEGTADALVLTEWKIVKSQDQLEEKIKEAIRQTELYSSGVLGGIEIANYRFLVMVSDKNLQMPENFIKETVVYRHINVAVDPSTPSVEAKA
jgi:hypothetical protein